MRRQLSNDFPCTPDGDIGVYQLLCGRVPGSSGRKSKIIIQSEVVDHFPADFFRII